MLPLVAHFTLNHKPTIVFIVAAQATYFALIIVDDINFLPLSPGAAIEF
jgi:hypothetical protein